MVTLKAEARERPHACSKRRRWLWVLGVSVLAGLGCVQCGRRPPEGETPAPTPVDPTVPEHTASAKKDSFLLQGRWLRSDGDYLLEVQWVGEDGRAAVKYFNPDPIYVSRAEVSQTSGATKLLVELQDTGYPGCVYTLSYDTNRHRLVGTYYQAALRETYPVEFTRQP